MHKQDLQTNSESADTESFYQSRGNSGEATASEKEQRFPERPNKEQVKTFPILAFEGKIHLITEKKGLSQALKTLCRESVLGFDTETRPTFKKGKQYSVSLLQLATANDAFLFRLNHLGLPEELASILTDPDILKVGVAILDDIRALRKLRKFEVKGFVDLSNIASELGIVTCGLRNLAAIFFGARISKKAQLTNWERPDFNSGQALYAATDAWICLEMYRFLDSENLLPENNIWNMPESRLPKSSRRYKNFNGGRKIGNDPKTME